jgi:hypothetical protein
LNYTKVDPFLAVALKTKERDDDLFTVFVSVKKGLGYTEITRLQKLGIPFNRNNPEIFSATISRKTISELSDQSWVRYLRLSTKLKMK